MSSTEQRAPTAGDLREKYTDWLGYAWLAYAFFIPFVRLFYLPVVYAKFQLAELIFLPLLLGSVVVYGRRLWWGWNKLSLLLTLYLAVNLVSGAWADNYSAVLEAIGRCYLAILFYCGYTYVRLGKTGRGKQILDAWLYGATVVAILTLLAYLAALLGYANDYTDVYRNYPYFGTIYRAAGPTGGSGMLVLVGMLPAIYAYRTWRTGERGGGWFFFLLGVLSLTFSKELVLLGAGCLLAEPLPLPRWFRWGIVASAAGVFWLGTHLIVIRGGEVAGTDLEKTFFTSERVLLRAGDYSVVESSYLALKRAGFSVGAQYPWLGTGPGQFNNYLPAEKAAGRYAAHLPDYDPHSTWVGAFSETGVFGFLAFLGLVIYFCTSFWRANQSAVTTNKKVLESYLLMILIVSVSIDTMNFRHLWVPLALLMALKDKPADPHNHLDRGNLASRK